MVLGSGDQPNLSLSNVPLSGNNYFCWSHRVWNALLAKGKSGFITCKHLKPVEGSPEYDAWIEVDALVRAWIINSITPELQAKWRKKQEIYIAAEYNIFMVDNKKLQSKKCFDKKMDKRNWICEHCKRKGHAKDTCFKLHEIPAWHKELMDKRGGHINAAAKMKLGDRKSEEPFKENLDINALVKVEVQKLLMQNTSESPIRFANSSIEFSGKIFIGFVQMDNSSWLIDSGATCHICINDELFDYLKPVTIKPKIFLLDGSFLTVSSAGPVTINSYIVHVYYLPGFKFNLLSDLSSNLILATGKQEQNLYILNCQPQYSNTLTSKLKSSDEALIWHRRLGHPSYVTFEHLSISPYLKNIPCDVCHKAKQSRLTFNKSSSQAQAIFELLHMDFWGPYKTATMNGCHYFLTIVDDYSRAT
ncbi:uncharacterized protein LOC127260403 [Andrographis paniculata]|uniref:uncharacterized protein LOC127260403 n=1 Tax=Andrographis paniculata TaxID=175694 RepID=UPI0021E95472|nr:uncharacterized protein LOC127260403 [Andrographis paniculata]